MRAEHLYKRFGDKPVLENVSLTVPAGAVLCLMAPSGWGKTTLLRCIAGLEKPDSGTVQGVPERIGYVFQEDRLCGHMSAVENVRLATGRRMDTEIIRAHLTELGLGDQLHQPVEELSGGQRRRVAIARAVLRRRASAAGRAVQGAGRGDAAAGGGVYPAAPEWRGGGMRHPRPGGRRRAGRGDRGAVNADAAGQSG